MKTNNAEYVISSSTPKRHERIKVHENFMKSTLKKMLDNNWEIKQATIKHKRPRIKKEAQPKQVVVTLGGNWTVNLSFEEYKQRGDGLKIVMKIY